MSKATTLVDQNEETARDAVLFPPAPRTLEQAGLSHDLIVQLVLKMLHFGADYSGGQIADKLGLEYSAVEPVLNFLKQTHQCEVFGGSMVGGPSFQYRITDAGRRRAILFLEQSHYIGVAPVPLATYQKYMHAHAAALPKSVNRDRVRKAFSHLVLSDRVLDQVGPAVAAGHSMFVYGPPGNGKTVIAQAIRNLLDGDSRVIGNRYLSRPREDLAHRPDSLGTLDCHWNDRHAVREREAKRSHLERHQFTVRSSAAFWKDYERASLLQHLSGFSLSRAIHRIQIDRERAENVHYLAEHRDLKRLVPRHVVDAALDRDGNPDWIGEGYVIWRDYAGAGHWNVIDAMEFDFEEYPTKPPDNGSQEINDEFHARKLSRLSRDI